MRKTFIAFLLLAMLPILGLPQAVENKPVLTEAPANFVRDGCSLFPDGDYADCCQAHDRDYYRGGTKAERKASDKRLEQCVRAKGHKFLSKMIYLGVRIGGVPWLPTSFRWGFGRDLKKKEQK